MKRTLLTETQLEVLEQALLAHGNILTFADLAAFLPGKSDAARRTFITRLVDAGWLVRIKRGVFQIAEMSSLGTLSISRFAVAQIIVPDSYVSFEAALQYWGLYDQLPAAVVSVALQQHKPMVVEGIRYRYVKTTEAYYYGWQTVEISHRQVRVAYPEKAMIDMLQFHRTPLSLNLVVEKLVDHRREIDFDRLEAFLLRANLTTLRIGGYMLDAIGVDTSTLQERSVASTSASRATARSDRYDARWRLYVDPLMLAMPGAGPPASEHATGISTICI
jgi:predicted transcriptional regulator of viral defense system